MYHHHPGGSFEWHEGPGIFGLLGFLVLIALLVLAVVLVVRLLRGRGHVQSAAWHSSPWHPGPWPDPAVAELRVRYARGELSREDYLERTTDLSGGPPPGSPSPGQ
jgi:putative membrane protein